MLIKQGHLQLTHVYDRLTCALVIIVETMWVSDSVLIVRACRYLLLGDLPIRQVMQPICYKELYCLTF
jgi:hypothetical protein